MAAAEEAPDVSFALALIYLSSQWKSWLFRFVEFEYEQEFHRRLIAFTEWPTICVAHSVTLPLL